MSSHKHDEPPQAKHPNYPDTRRIDRDTPRALWLFLFCMVVVVAGMFFGSVVYLASRGADVQPLINAVSDVDGVVPGVLSTLVLIVLGMVKRQNNRVEALAGREGPSSVRDELAELREAVARVEAAPVLTSGPIPVTVAPGHDPGVVDVTVDEPAARSPYAVADDGAYVTDPLTWRERTGQTPPVREYVASDYGLVEQVSPPPTRLGRREAVPDWAQVNDLQEAPPQAEQAPQRGGWSPR